MRLPDKMFEYMQKNENNEEEEIDDENENGDKKSKKVGDVYRSDFKQFFIKQK